MFSSENCSAPRRKIIYISLSTAAIFSVITVLLQVFFVQPVNGYLNITQYCKAFDENFQPIICIIKNGTKLQLRPNYHPPIIPPPPPPPSGSHHPHPPGSSTPPPTPQYPILQPNYPPDYEDFDEDDDDNDDCSCEVTCQPIIVHQRSIVIHNHNHHYSKNHFEFDNNDKKLGKIRNKRTTTTSYRCRSCGTECSVSTTRPPTCYCVIPASRSECTCTATCAAFRYYRPNYFQPFINNREMEGGDDEGNCIFSVSALEDWRLGEERPPYVCECKRSKEAENTSRPDFICICQRIPIRH